MYPCATGSAQAVAQTPYPNTPGYSWKHTKNLLQKLVQQCQQTGKIQYPVEYNTPKVVDARLAITVIAKIDGNYNKWVQSP